MYQVPNRNVDFARIVRCITRRYVLLQSSTSGFVLYLSMYHYGTVPTEYILVCTCNSNTFTSMYQYVLGTYWYILSKTKNWMCIIMGNRTKDFMHSILRTIPLRYYRSFHGNIIGKYNVYIQWNLHWCCTDLLAGVGRPARTPSRIPQRPRLPAGPGHDVTGPSPGMIDLNQPMPMLAQQEMDLKSSSWLQNTPC
jgi:hypothetical protein